MSSAQAERQEGERRRGGGEEGRNASTVEDIGGGTIRRINDTKERKRMAKKEETGAFFALWSKEYAFSPFAIRHKAWASFIVRIQKTDE